MRYPVRPMEEIRGVELTDSERRVLLRLLNDEKDRLLNVRKMREGINNDTVEKDMQGLYRLAGKLG